MTLVVYLPIPKILLCLQRHQLYKPVSYTHLEEGSSVLDLTQLYCNVNDIPVTVETTNNYIQGIDKDVYKRQIKSRLQY